ncbi:MAG: hypothetical protein HYZ36_05070, partial [Pedosphaera parvula]|nr:hypothetical protein [Pedosphaera parvula]
MRRLHRSTEAPKVAVRGAVVAAALLAALPSAGGTLPEARGRATGFFSEPNAARAARQQEGGAEILLEVTLLSGVTVEVGGGGPPGEADGHEVSGGACSPPGEVQGLLFVDGQTLSWSPPADPGVPPAVLYDTLRTTQASDFTDNFSATCIESDGGDQTTTEAGNPPLGRAFFYQVGAKDPCGEGSLGTASNGGARQARSCSGGNGGLEAPNGAGWPSDRPYIARHPTAKNAGTVYLHSGEYHLEQVDLRIPGRGLDFEWRRTYRSREGRLTNMGQGWDFSYNRRVELSGDDPADR